MKETSRAKSIWHEESNKIAIVLNNSYQSKIRSGEINKHVSDGVNKHPVENKCDLKPKLVKTKEAKNFSKSEAEMVDVMDTRPTRDFNH